MDTPSPAPPAPHWAALDGLRGLAVAAVVAYHLGHVPGGFLGVDLFFVLSGFLITSLLLREQRRSGRIDLQRFWERRARRLLPALGATLVAVVVAARVALDHDRLPGLRWDALTTAAYVANWRFAWAPAGGYFAEDPSPLRHTWSLAIEEQYYVVWPLVVVAVVVLARRRGWPTAAVVGAVAGAGAVASAAWMALHAGSWSSDRLYLGTDTRVLAPLVGALLACALRPRLDAARAAPLPRPVAAGLAGGGVVALGVAVALVHPTDPWMFRGGFVLAALAGAAAVAGSVLDQGGPAARVLALAPLRWLGERSYGLYLYSWPTQVVAEAEGLDDPLRSVVVVAVSLGLAAASHRWLEMPIRQGARLPRPRATGAVAGAVVLAVVAAVVAVTITEARPDPLAAKTQEQFEAEATRPAVTVPDDISGRAGEARPLRVLVVGDSVGYTLGEHAPDQVVGVASVDSRALPGCGLLVSGARPAAAVEAGAPATYDGCAEPVAEADRIGLEGRPDVVLLVTGAWETSDHVRDGRTLGPGDEEWAEEVRGLLAERVDRLAATGATVALWSDPCPPSAERRERQAWYAEEVLAAVAADDPRARVVDPSPVVCRDGLPLTDVPEVGDPRPDDGQHWSEDGAAWLWRTWVAPNLRFAHLEALRDRGLTTLVVGDSIGFTLDFRGAEGALDAGVELVEGATAIGCGLVREGRSAAGGRDLSADCAEVTAREDAVVAEQDPDFVVAVWGAWEMAGVLDLPAAGAGVPPDPAYTAYVEGLLRDRIAALGEGGARVVLLGVDCWPPVNETRAAERVAWWQELSRRVATDTGAAYLDPTEVLCEDGEPREIPGVGDPRPEDGAHWNGPGATWFWSEFLGPRIAALAADG